MNSEKLQNALEAFQITLREFRSSLGVIGDGEISGEVPDVQKYQKGLFNALTAACAAHKVRLTSESSSPVELNRVLRMEHQSWVKGETDSGQIECVNVMDYDKIKIV